jgi:type I restriction enzyme M protein
MGVLIDRRHKELRDEEIQKIAATYHAWRGEGGKYEDIKGFCKSATLDEIRQREHILTPGRYVGVEDIEEDEELFEEKMKKLALELGEQFKRSKGLEKEIEKNLSGIGYVV